MDKFDEYTICRERIGRGGMGVVHEAVSHSGERVAIKVLSPVRVDERVISQFKSEYQALTNLNHPNIARVKKIGFHDGQFYIASEFIEGKPIAEFVRGWKPVDMVPLFIQVLEALDYIHRNGLIHLDIKSGNVLVLDSRPETRAASPDTSHQSRVTSHVKIIDFGLAMAPEQYQGNLVGTASHIAPEVALGRRDEVDARADLFSFGVLMYRCITWGDLPFARPAKAGHDTIRRVIENEGPPDPPSFAHTSRPGFVPAYLDKIVMHLLAHDPRNRFYGNARAVINALKTRTPEHFRNESKIRASYLQPEANRHVGREREQGRLFTQILSFINKPDYQPSITAITGGKGIGKTHLLHKISDIFCGHIEQTFLNVIKFPASDAAYNYLTDSVDKQLASKSKPVVILIDDIHELYNQVKRGQKNLPLLNILQLLQRAAGFAYSKHRTTALLDGIPCISIFFTLNKDELSLKKIFELLGARGNFIDEINLKPLTYLELDTYIKLTPAFKNKDVPREWVDELYRKTNGIPAAVKEELTEIDAHGMLFDLDGNIIINPLLPKAKKSAPATIRARLSEIYSKCDADEKRILNLLAVWYFKNAEPAICFNDIFNFLPLVFLKQKLVGLIQNEILISDMDGREYKFFNQDYFPSHIYGRMPVNERKFWHDKLSEYALRQFGSTNFTLFHLAFGNPCNASFKAILKLGSLLLGELGNAALARDVFEHGIEASGNNFKLRACFTAYSIDACLHESMYSRARTLFESVKWHLNYRPGSKMWWIAIMFRMTGIAIGQGDFKKAESLIRETQRLIPNDLAATPISVMLKNYQARYYYEMALGGGNSHKVDLLNYAKNIYQEGEELEAMLPAHAKLRIRNNNLFLVLIALGKYEEAVFELEKKLARNEKQKSVFEKLFSSFMLADTYRLLLKYDQARKIAEDAMKIANETNQGKWLMRIHNILANIAHDENRFREALTEDDARLACSVLIEDPAEHHRTSIEIWNHKGHCYKELGEFDRAILHFQAVVEGNDKITSSFVLMSAHEGLGEVFFLKNDYEKAIDHLNLSYKAAITLPPESTEAFRFPILDLKARSLIRCGRVADAEGLLGEMGAISAGNAMWLANYDKLRTEVESAGQNPKTESGNRTEF